MREGGGHNALPARERQVLAFVREHVRDHGHAPTTREIARACGLASASGASRVVDRLARAGLLAREHSRPRGITVAQPSRAPAPLSPRARLALPLTAALERVHLVALCRVAPLAPDLETTEGLLRLTLARLTQLRALEAALSRQASGVAAPSIDEERRVGDYRSRLAEHVERIVTWPQYLVHEVVFSEATVAGLDSLLDELDGFSALQALAGSRAAAERCLGFARDQLASARRTSGDRGTFDRSIAHARRAEEALLAASGDLVGVSTGRVRA